MAVCTAESTHTVNITGGDSSSITYLWGITSQDAVISSAIDDVTVTVASTEDDLVTPFTLNCTVTQSGVNSYYSEDFTHDRTLATPPASAADIYYTLEEPSTASGASSYNYATVDFFEPADVNKHGIFYTGGMPGDIDVYGEYGRDGTLVLESGNYFEYPLIFPSNSEWQFIRCYDIDGGNFKIMVIVYHGNGRASYLFGNQSVSPILVDNYLNIAYTPQITKYQMGEFLDIPSIEITYNMDDFITDVEITYEMNDFTTTP